MRLLLMLYKLNFKDPNYQTKSNLLFYEKDIAFFYICLCIRHRFMRPWETQENPCEVEFDQSAMFQNYANYLIIPAYTDLKSKIDALATATNDFTNTPISITLGDLRSTLF